MDFRRIWVALAIVCGVVAAAMPSWGGVPARGGANPSGIQRPSRVAGFDSDRRVDVNNLNMWVTNYGSYAWDILTGNAGLVYPKGTTKTAVFASGLWLGCTVASQVRIAAAVYGQEYGPGEMVDPPGTPDNPNRADYKVYKVARFSGDPNDTAHVERAGTYPEDPLVHHSWSEYIAGAKPHGAPTRIYRMDDTSTPAPSDSVDIEGPDVLGDQMLWCVYNDADPALHGDPAGSTPPLGVEIQQTTFGFNRQGALGNTVFVKFRVINKGSNTLDNMFASLWSDPDLGGFTDDLVGCDTTLSLGFCYNATNNDQQYGASPPAVGYDFFLGPVDAAGDTLPLTSFNKYINGTDPGSFDETYNYMQGLLPDGSDLIDPQTGQVVKFFHPGDPVSGAGWLDSNPADRRFLLNSGPFVMAPGDTQEIVGAIIIGQCRDRLGALSDLRFSDTFAQDAFDRGFKLPSPPAQPHVDVATDHGKVVLSWDANSRNNYNEPGYAFEGYNVYQGASIAGPWTLVATYDEINQVRIIFDTVFDKNTCQILQSFPVAFGSDVGVRFTHTLTQDAVRGGNLRDGTEYFFAVTAYSQSPTGLPRVLENPQAVIRVTPQRPAGGTDLATASVTPVIHLRKDTAVPPSTDVVSVQVVDPNLVTGHVYKVIFEPVPVPFTTQIGQDTATVVYTWSLVDSTLGQVVLGGQINKRGDEDYRIVDGLLVKVNGKYFPQFQEAAYRNIDPTNRRPIDGVNAGLESFGGGAGLGASFLGSTIDPTTDPAALDSMTSVQLRYNGTQKAYRYLRLEKQTGGGAPPQGRYYPFTGFYDVGFTAWDAINEVQLDVAFVERGLTDDAGVLSPDSTTVPTYDRTWFPDESPLGGREYLFVIRRPYSDTPKAELMQDGVMGAGGYPVLYAMWAHRRAATDTIFDPADYFEYVWANPARPNDVYAFSTASLRRGNTALAKVNLARIRAVPNPYYNRSRYELNQFSRVIRFMNLPEACTIRIFNLGGDLVRTLQKTDPTTSTLSWDIQTESQLPVASGVYIYHVDAPGVGTIFGRVVVFMEKERLNNF